MAINQSTFQLKAKGALVSLEKYLGAAPPKKPFYLVGGAQISFDTLARYVQKQMGLASDLFTQPVQAEGEKDVVPAEGFNESDFNKPE
jgi:hypothetical protein